MNKVKRTPAEEKHTTAVFQMRQMSIVLTQDPAHYTELLEALGLTKLLYR